MAHAAVPVPKPKPTSAPLDPQAAISRLVGPGSGLGANVTAYAPSAPVAIGSDVTDEVALYLVGKLSEDGEPIGDGLVWRVFREMPDATGEVPLVARHQGGDLDIRLKPGRYVVHVAYGRAAVSRTVDLTRAVNSETFVLDAGGLQLDAVLDEAEQPLGASAHFEVFSLGAGTRKRVGTVQAGAVARLPAGSYHIVSRYGGVNAVRSADVVVEAGKLTRVSLRHQAGTVRLRLVRGEGGEAIANTAWTVLDPEGRAVFERVGAHANVTLAAGRYEVVARHRETEFKQTIEVASGDDEDVTVVARRL